MPFTITGLDPAPFLPLYGLGEAELARRGVYRHRVDAVPGYPDRIELRDAELHETVLLLNHTHQPADTPYRASHAVFVREGAKVAARFVDRVPDALASRLISLRAFSRDDLMIDADGMEGSDLVAAIEHCLDDPNTAYLHAHYAKRGCFAARVDRL